MGRDELDSWRDGLIVDQGDILIESAKRWLGPLRTPFNKHELLARLEAFLRRDANADAIVGLMDRLDRRIAAMALYCGAGRPTDLARLAAGDDLPEDKALARVRSLRERLVLYSRKAGRYELVALSPPLAPRLSAVLSPSDMLARARPSGAEPGADAFTLACALMSASVHVKPAWKGLSEPTQKARALLEATAPGLASVAALREGVLGTLEREGLFGRDEGRPAPDPRRFVDYCDSLGDDAPWALAAAAFGTGEDDIDEPLRSRLFRYAASALPLGLATDRADVDRAAAAAAAGFLRAAGGAGAQAALESGAAYRLGPAVGKALAGLGALSARDDGLWLRSPVAGPGAAGSGPSIVVEESHEIRVLPEAGCAARAFVATVARLERTGLVWSAVLDKAAAKAAYAYGFDAAGLASRLEALSGRALPQSMSFSLSAWEAETRSARIRVGVVAVLDGHLAGVLDHAPGGASLVKERLAKGVYLLDARDARDAERALKRLGVDVDIREAPAGFGPRPPTALPPLSAAESVRPLAFGPIGDTLEGGAAAAPLVDSLVAALRAMKLSEDESDWLEDRIRARLVLGVDQLAALAAAGEPPGDGVLAGAMDYPGKARVVERALRDGQAVELTCVDESGTRTKVSGVPMELRKTANGLVAVLRAQEGTRMVPMSAVAKARRLLGSLYGA